MQVTFHSSLAAEPATWDFNLPDNANPPSATQRPLSPAPGSHADNLRMDLSIRNPLERLSSSLELARSEHVQALASVFLPLSEAQPSSSSTSPRSPRAASRRVQFSNSVKQPAAPPPSAPDWENSGLCSVQDGTYNLCVSTLRGGHRTQLAQALMEDVKNRTNIAGSNRRKRLAKGKGQVTTKRKRERNSTSRSDDGCPTAPLAPDLAD